MFREAANNDTFDEFRKIREVGDRSVGTGVIRIEIVSFLSSVSTRACLSCAGKTPLSMDKLHR